MTQRAETQRVEPEEFPCHRRGQEALPLSRSTPVDALLLPLMIPGHHQHGSDQAVDGKPGNRRCKLMAMDQRPTLLGRYREELQVRHYARRTSKSYELWVRRFMRFHGLRHPRELGPHAVHAFLTHLAVEQGVSASTQNQALSALLFLYRDLLEIDAGNLEGVVRARQKRSLPVVLTTTEVQAVLGQLDGVVALVANLLYGNGLRLTEALRLRIKDLDFEKRQLTVRSGKGDKDRISMLPFRLIHPLGSHLESVRQLHKADLEAGWGNTKTRQEGRHHIDQSLMQKHSGEL